MSLLDVVDPRFRLRVGDRTFDRETLAMHARGITIPSGAKGRIVEIPARDPLEALLHLDAAARAHAVPLPSTRVAEPRLAADLSGVVASDLALVLRTSGSTGTPRHPGFCLESIARSARRIAANLALHGGDRIGLLQPTDHGFGLIGQLLAGAAVGAEVVAASRTFPNERAQLLLDSEVSVFAGVPYGLQQLVSAFERASRESRRHVRQIGAAGGALSPTLATRLRTLFPRASLVHQYGCTEAGPRLTSAVSGSRAFDFGSVGSALEGVALVVLDADATGRGEIAFVSDMAMARYVGDDAATDRVRVATKHGPAIRTGDLGRIAHSGSLFVEGRLDDVIKVRGEKVALDAVAKVAEAAGANVAFATAVPPRPHAIDASIVVIYEGPVELALGSFVGKLPPGVLPKRLVRVPKLPRLAGGKVDRVAARALAVGSAAPRLGALS